MVAGSAAFFLEHGVATSPSNKCRYKTGKCTNTRSSKRNGQPHMLCLYHRDKANKIQRKFDRQKRQSVRQKKSAASGGSSPVRSSAPSSMIMGGAAAAFANSMANAPASSFTGLLAQQDVEIYSDSESSRFSTDSESSTVSLDQVWRELPNSAMLLELGENYGFGSSCASSVATPSRYHGSGPLSHEEIDFLYAAMLE